MMTKANVFMQKFLKLIDKLERDTDGSVIDRLNRAEKRDIVKSAQDMIKIRDLRNSIAHEYIPEALIDIYRDVLKYCPDLIQACNKAIKYSKKYQ